MGQKPKKSTFSRIEKTFWSERPSWFKATVGWWMLPLLYAGVICANFLFFVFVGVWRDGMKKASKWGKGIR